MHNCYFAAKRPKILYFVSLLWRNLQIGGHTHFFPCNNTSQVHKVKDLHYKAYVQIIDSLQLMSRWNARPPTPHPMPQYRITIPSFPLNFLPRCPMETPLEHFLPTTFLDSSQVLFPSNMKSFPKKWAIQQNRWSARQNPGAVVFYKWIVGRSKTAFKLEHVDAFCFLQI